MKLFNIFCICSIATLIQAETTHIQKYIEQRNSDYINKIEKQREKMVEARDYASKVRVFQSTLRECKGEALFARVERNHTAYR